MSSSFIKTTTSRSSPDGERQIIRVGEEDRVDALSQLVRAPGAGSGSGSGAGSCEESQAGARRFLAYASDNNVELDLLWSLPDKRGRLEYTVLVVPAPGRTAMLFATKPRSHRQVASIARLIRHACDQARGGEISVVQSLLEVNAQLEQASLIAGGFQTLARLSYLERAKPRPGSVAPVQWPSGFSTRTYHDADRPLWRRILEASYVDTMDCPGLLGLRRTEDILHGHMSVGRFDPQLWSLLCHGDEPVGVMMLNPARGSDTIELVYTGIAPHMRGRGLGARLLQHGLHSIQEKEQQTVTLAVDETNEPALHMYRRSGFRRALRRIAMIRCIDDHDAAPQSNAPEA